MPTRHAHQRLPLAHQRPRVDADALVRGAQTAPTPPARAAWAGSIPRRCGRHSRATLGGTDALG